MNADHGFYLYCFAHDVAEVTVAALRLIARMSEDVNIPDTTMLLDETQLQNQGSRDFGSEYSANINGALYSPCSKGAEHQPIETTIIVPNAFIIQEGRIEERV